ncbi:MAG: hypothetical protein CM1200mP20_10660 [Pseudomonadota bacterium]|nr:MAG: hypothetical protein CM1200mP20_10660 [Pseudomonadota bacterium]
MEEQVGQCVYDNAASITRGMKMGIIKYGFVDDAVYWNVSSGMRQLPEGF